MRQTIYLDTTIPNAYYDDKNQERQKQTKKFWDQLKEFDVFVSPLVLAEIGRLNNDNRKKQLLSLLVGVEELALTPECEKLADEYVKAGIIPEKYRDDAVHIATAVVNAIDYLVSWNFEHIVKVKTRRMVGLIDAEKGYKPIEIVAPPEL